MSLSLIKKLLISAVAVSLLLGPVSAKTPRPAILKCSLTAATTSGLLAGIFFYPTQDISAFEKREKFVARCCYLGLVVGLTTYIFLQKDGDVMATKGDSAWWDKVVEEAETLFGVFFSAASFSRGSGQPLPGGTSAREPLPQEIKSACRILELNELSLEQGAVLTSYKRLALKYHPDKNPRNRAEAEKKFKAMKNAFDLVKSYLEEKGRWRS